jgi:hypothetical protein
MTAKTRSRSITTTLIALTFLAAVIATASDDSLIRIERRSDADRNALIDAGITLVAETDDALFAIGAAEVVLPAAEGRSLIATMVKESTGHTRFALAGLRPGFSETDLLACGTVIARGFDWLLVEEIDFSTPECRESSGWFLHLMDMDPLAAIKAQPAPKQEFRQSNPLVQEMVDRVDGALALSHWAALSQSTGWTTRHSSSQGCLDAASYVHDLFSVFGLAPEYQHHTGGYADNVIGTIPGLSDPDLVYIAIGHLDDLPSSGPAPGADDNASGTAMVTALAEVMSDYCFARTTKFVAVTGEEQGLYGSNYYADQAAAAGENIQAVLNGDMIGWEGDGQPAVENLDVNYNSGSQWLAQAMIDASATYGTGLQINAFSCSSMVYSDHAPFWSNGFSAVCGITDNEGFCGQSGNYPFYHQTSDTIANCGPGAADFEAAVIRTYLATMAHLAQPLAKVPEPPSAVVAQADGDNRIALSWAGAGPGLTYRIFRSTGTCADPGPAVPVGETGSTSFVDATVSGGVPYAYFVAATAAGSCSSEISSCVGATTTGTCTEPPSFAGIDSVANPGTTSCRLDLGWQPPQSVWCGGPVVYNVYRSATPAFTPSSANRIAHQISATDFHDIDVIFAENYHYIVRAVDLAHGGEDGNTRELASTPTGPSVIGTWNDDAGDTAPAALVQASPWHVAAGAGVSGAAYATGTYGNNLCAALTTPPLELDTAPQVEFWSKYDTENDWDKGELQISTDGGSSWQRVSMNYPGVSTHTNDACGLGTGGFFTGGQSTYAAFTADLSPWTGQSAMLRWVLSSDGSLVGDGWWIDEISITNVAVPGVCTGAEVLFSDGFESGDTSAWSN